MTTITKPLMAQTAADLMTEALVIIPQEMSLQGAARLLLQHQISGAPVVNDAGVCIGVLSSTDFVHWAEKEKQATHRGPANDEYCPSWQIVEPEKLPADAVGNYMTTSPVTVVPSLRIAELARLMVDAHIHRVIVVNQQGQPSGIVSSTDILAAMAYADPATGHSEPEKGTEP